MYHYFNQSYSKSNLYKKVSEMKKIMLKTLSITLLSFAAMTVANAADTSKAETNMQIKACAKKKQGDWTSYGYKGVTFNGTCEPNADGKLQFKFPAP